jgi:Leucine-rich repeat (LRR) protein
MWGFPFFYTILIVCLLRNVAAANKILLETQGQQSGTGSSRRRETSNDNNRNNKNRHRHLEHSRVDRSEGETFLIRQGRHPSISYPNLANMNDTEIHIRWVKPDVATGKTLVVEADDCPRHFLWLSDQAVEAELQYRLQPWNVHQQWSDRVLVEKIYFTLFYGGTGLASKYLDAADHFETDLRGWNIMDREKDKPVDANVHCSWEGLACNDDGELTAFRLEGFALEGTLPNDFNLLTKLEVLDLNFNNLRGTIPADWGTGLTNLRSLNLAANELTGRLPPTLSNMVKLENVWLSGNQFRGTISEKLFEKWTNLVVGDFSHNNFRGTFPKSLVTKASNLQSLFLEGNQLSGSLPSFGEKSTVLIGLKSLEVMDLGRNKITGTVPDYWFSLPRIRDWNLAGNQFTGSIPTSIMKMTSLQVLVLVRSFFVL